MARRAVKTAGRAVDMVIPLRAGVTVLLYHRVGAGSQLEVDLPEPLFRAQMEEIAASGRAVPLGEALMLLAEARRSGSSLPQPAPVVVTFDDGTADVVEVAAPILSELGVPATLFVATAFVEEGRHFPAGGKPASWSALADAASSGVLDLGSHTHDHLLLDRLPVSEAEHQLDRSLELLRDRAGVRAADFAYPKAVAASGAVASAVAKRFRSAFVAGGGVNAPGADPYRLARAPIQRSDGMRWFARKLDGGLALEGRLREAANRWRYSGATT